MDYKIKIQPNDKGSPPGKLADAELDFTDIDVPGPQREAKGHGFDCDICGTTGTYTVPSSLPSQTSEEFLRRYPRVTAHIIAESLGYATPSRAAMIGLDGLHGRENWCEWIYSCYNRDARRALRDAIRGRHHHHGYMAEYKLVRALVEKVRAGAYDGSWFASWF